MKEQELLQWFDDSVHEFLGKHARDRLSALDNDYQRLKKLLDQTDDVTVCFLGNSGIGKSTLLNAIAAGSEQILPAGGIGPLTAQATEVHYSEEPCFEVVYHKKMHLWNVAFGLETRLVHQLRREKAAQGLNEVDGAFDSTKDLSEFADDEDTEGALEIVDISSSESEAGNDPLQGRIKQAKQIVTGDQFSDRNLPYLVDALRMACDLPSKWGETIDEADLKRIARVKAILKSSKDKRNYICKQSDEHKNFKVELQIHAAGFLSPLIERIYVGWSSPVLKSGVVLVDLPGVGIAQDSYRDVTKQYVRDKARAVIVVVDRAGPTESTVDLLRDSGYWQRLVGAADDPNSDPCSMIMAVTRVDDVAEEEWRNFISVDGAPKPKKREVFERLVREFKPRMIRQITEQLVKIETSDNEAVQTARVTARSNILQSMEVHPVSAPELRKLLLDDEDDRAFLQNIGQTGIPLLQQSLMNFAQLEREKRQIRLREVSSRFSSTLLNELRIIDTLWRQEGRAADEAARLEAALVEILAPKRKEYDRRVGAFREFLTETVQEKIQKLVLEARAVAENDVNKYLSRLQNVHWATLRAAVRRGGAYHGSRIINLPDDISNYFQEPMAAVWGQKLLRDVRSRTTALSTDIENMVEEICLWARENGGASINKSLLEHQQQRIALLAEQMKQVGKEAVDELRETVKTKLTDAIRKPIKISCETFVTNGNDIGSGVKTRILELFRQLAAAATLAAQKPAIEILQTNFAKVRDEIQEAFQQGGDHIQSTADLIVERHEAKVKRSDAQKRGPILAELEGIFDKRPEHLHEEVSEPDASLSEEMSNVS